MNGLFLFKTCTAMTTLCNFTPLIALLTRQHFIAIFTQQSKVLIVAYGTQWTNHSLSLQRFLQQDAYVGKVVS